VKNPAYTQAADQGEWFNRLRLSPLVLSGAWCYYDWQDESVDITAQISPLGMSETGTWFF